MVLPTVLLCSPLVALADGLSLPPAHASQHCCPKHLNRHVLVICQGALQQGGRLGERVERRGKGSDRIGKACVCVCVCVCGETILSLLQNSETGIKVDKERWIEEEMKQMEEDIRCHSQWQLLSKDEIADKQQGDTYVCTYEYNLRQEGPDHPGPEEKLARWERHLL